MDVLDKSYVYFMSKELNLDEDYLFLLLKRMNDNDLTYFYFYFGQYFASNDEIIKKKLIDIIHRYQRKDKLKKIIKKMKIKVTDFAERHFDKDFGGTKILDFSVEEFEKKINKYSEEIKKNIDNIKTNKSIQQNGSKIKVMNGYADFCKLVAIPNFSDAKVGSMPIILENYQYLRSGYSARREGELPVLSRWLELPLGKPVAEWLILVLYDKNQIDKEAKVEYNKNPSLKKYKSFDADWGIVAILGQSHSGEEPMKPETMLRNALGIEEGGSGVKLDREKYLESVEFWNKNATIK